MNNSKSVDTICFTAMMCIVIVCVAIVVLLKF